MNAVPTEPGVFAFMLNEEGKKEIALALVRQMMLRIEQHERLKRNDPNLPPDVTSGAEFVLHQNKAFITFQCLEISKQLPSETITTSDIIQFLEEIRSEVRERIAKTDSQSKP